MHVAEYSQAPSPSALSNTATGVSAKWLKDAVFRSFGRLRKKLGEIRYASEQALVAGGPPSRSCQCRQQQRLGAV
jgi:hypothetical protein